MQSSDFLLPILLWGGLGLYAVLQGFTRLRAPTNEFVLFAIPEMGALALVRLFQGKTEAMHKKSELMKPERLRRSGYFYVLGGGLLLVAACLQVVALAIQLKGA